MTATHSSGTRSTTKTTTTKRYWRRTDKPQAWWPWGLLPLLGLAVLFLFGAMVTAPAIQAEVRNQVGERFDSAGIAASDLSADGRRVTARVGAAGADDVFLSALAASTKCDTWAGEMTCPTVVNIERAEGEPASPAATPAIADIRPHQFEFMRSGDAITLRGEAPTAAERDRILGVAGQYFEKVDDQLTISDNVATAQFSPAADRALAVVNHLVDGQASWSGEALSVSGVANASDMTAARERFDEQSASGTAGRFDVQALVQATDDSASCNDAFSALFANASIRFQTNSATIDAGNDELLQRIANVARDCPGTLVIEGHTDSRGDAGMNQALSFARAGAVRDALAALGIEASRVTAIGHGAAKPVADNASAAGRAENRRIAIFVQN